MNIKELIFGGSVKAAGGGGAYRDSIQAWLPIKNIIGGVAVTRDNRFIKILEVLPVNIYLKSPSDRQNIISSFAAYLKIAPDSFQLQARTLPADTGEYVERMKQYAGEEENESCREMIEDNIREIGQGVASDAIRHRFFLIFQYEAGMKAAGYTAAAIIQRLNERRILPGGIWTCASWRCWIPNIPTTLSSSCSMKSSTSAPASGSSCRRVCLI